MTVQELIEQLQKFEDKTKKVAISIDIDYIRDFGVMDFGDEICLIG